MKTLRTTGTIALTRRAGLFAVRCEPAATGGESGEHSAEVFAGDVAGESETGGGPADPLAVGFARAGVVGVERLGDTRELVRLLADTELGDRQHAPAEGQRPVPPGTRTPNRVIHCEENRPSGRAYLTTPAAPGDLSSVARSYDATKPGPSR